MGTILLPRVFVVVYRHGRNLRLCGNARTAVFEGEAGAEPLWCAIIQFISNGLSLLKRLLRLQGVLSALDRALRILRVRPVLFPPADERHEQHRES